MVCYFKDLLKHFEKADYQPLYQLSVNDFFDQIMLRQRYFAMLEHEYCDETEANIKPMIDHILSGNVLLDREELEEYSPSKVSFHFPALSRGVKILSFNTSVEIAATLLAFADKRGLSFDETVENYSELERLLFTPRQLAMSQNFNHKEYGNKSYNQIFSGQTMDSVSCSDLLLEVDLRRPMEDLVNSFEDIVKKAKNESRQIEVPKETAETVIDKCRKYKVVESFDICKMSEIILNRKIKQKEMAKLIDFHIDEGWSETDYRKKTLKYMNMVFEQNFYIQFLK